MHCGARPLLLLCLLDFARSPTDAKLQTSVLRRCLQVSRYAPAVSSQLQYPREVLHALRCHALTAQLPWVSAASLASSKSSSRNMVTACTTLGYPGSCSCSALRLSTKLSFWVLNLYCVIGVQYVLSCLTVFRRLLLCPLIIILIQRILPQYLRHQTCLALARAILASP